MSVKLHIPETVSEYAFRICNVTQITNSVLVILYQKVTMYADLISNLTTADRKALADRGVPNARVSEWRTGLRLPTRPQALALAEVTNIDPMALEKELVLIEAEKEAATKPTMRELIDRLRKHTLL